jgi:hypothetical protein
MKIRKASIFKPLQQYLKEIALLAEMQDNIITTIDDFHTNEPCSLMAIIEARGIGSLQKFGCFFEIVAYDALEYLVEKYPPETLFGEIKHIEEKKYDLIEKGLSEAFLLYTPIMNIEFNDLKVSIADFLQLLYHQYPDKEDYSDEIFALAVRLTKAQISDWQELQELRHAINKFIKFKENEFMRTYS